MWLIRFYFYSEKNGEPWEGFENRRETWSVLVQHGPG